MTTLSDLFISYKLVEPPAETPAETPADKYVFYSNLDRAKQVTSSNNLNWKVGGSSNYENSLGWSVAPYNSTNVMLSDEDVESEISKYKSSSETFDMSTNEKIQYWKNKFEKFGVTPFQMAGILSAMKTECSLNPLGAVNKYELKHGSETTKGWENAGEGTIGFTTWSTKLKFIKKFNNHPLREGEKITEDKNEYAKASTRHICDLSDNDQALITFLFYENLINKTKDLDLNYTIAEFYLQKAGREHSKETDAYKKAIATGKKYQETHERHGHIAASKVNQFLKSIDNSKNMMKALGYESNIS